jgi:hypothetical protein
MNDETPRGHGAHRQNISAGEISRTVRTMRWVPDERAPLWRGRWAATPETLRTRFENYVEAFEDFVSERRAA